MKITIYYDVNVKKKQKSHPYADIITFQPAVERIPPYWIVASGFLATHLNNRKQKTGSHLSGCEEEGTDPGDRKEVLGVGEVL